MLMRRVAQMTPARTLPQGGRRHSSLLFIEAFVNYMAALGCPEAGLQAASPGANSSLHSANPALPQELSSASTTDTCNYAKRTFFRHGQGKLQVRPVTTRGNDTAAEPLKLPRSKWRPSLQR